MINKYIGFRKRRDTEQSLWNTTENQVHEEQKDLNTSKSLIATEGKDIQTSKAAFDPDTSSCH